MERAGTAPGLSSYRGPSQLLKAIMPEEEIRCGRPRSYVIVEPPKPKYRRSTTAKQDAAVLKALQSGWTLAHAANAGKTTKEVARRIARENNVQLRRRGGQFGNRNASL